MRRLIRDACKNRAGMVKEKRPVQARVEDVLTGHLGPSSIVTDYHKYLAMNRAVYKKIISHHEGIKTSNDTTQWRKIP